MTRWKSHALRPSPQGLRQCKRERNFFFLIAAMPRALAWGAPPSPCLACRSKSRVFLRGSLDVSVEISCLEAFPHKACASASGGRNQNFFYCRYALGASLGRATPAAPRVHVKMLRVPPRNVGISFDDLLPSCGLSWLAPAQAGGDIAFITSCTCHQLRP